MPPPATIFWKMVDENQVYYFIWTYAAINNMPHLPQLGVYSVLGRGCDIKI